ncbi:MAG: NFACT RNA binding domain-containing protein [Candidatus Stygibacter frigidus]|nr:NFACT RNA binding domain-containing protein [Candidatus Stygibacter frigidus]
MQYKYIAQFAREKINPGLFYRSVKRWRDQYAIFFNENKYLNISLMQQDPLCFFTDKDIIEWGSAPELAMMDQHLKRAKLDKISISDKDRIIILQFSKPDPFQGRQQLDLILELIPQFGNIILVRHENEKPIIIDCAKKISLAENRQRQLLPAVEYEPPPAGFVNDKSEITFPLSFTDNMQVIEEAEAGFQNINELLEAVYYEGWLQKLSDQNLRSQRKILYNKKKKKTAKLLKLKAELDDAEKQTKWLQMGELLKANIQQVKPGSDQISLINYYDPAMAKITIDLQPEKSMQWNINHYFKKYRKAKTGKLMISEQIKLTENEIAELDKTMKEIEEINLLLPGEKLQHVSGKNSVSDNITRLIIDDNWIFLIGRNSTENDLITTRIAQSQDWWFHTRIYKGTHVVLRNFKKQELPEHLLRLGCRLAAYFSKAGKSTNVPVDYTQIRHVRKPRGSAPGYVIYTDQKTLYVDPMSLRDAREEITDWQK